MNSLSLKNLDKLNSKEYIIIKGARVNNLKNIDLAIPRKKFIVITGLSGSGKSSLAFDTLFAEGHRLYAESLSSYARQFIGKIEKPSVDYIKGLSPAIAIEQHSNIKNSRSTVGTLTEIYDYLRILYARIGITYSPISNEMVKQHTITDILEYINSKQKGTKIIISFPIILKSQTLKEKLKSELLKGFIRLIIKKNIYNIEDILNNSDLEKQIDNDTSILIDRISVDKDNPDNISRIYDSVQTAFFEGDGICFVEKYGKEKKKFSDRFELDGIKFEVPSTVFFNFNNSYGSCKKCNGLGNIFDIDPSKVVPNNKLSIYDGAILPWQSPAMNKWLKPLLKNFKEYNFPINTPYKDLTKRQIEIIWKGYKQFEGLNKFFDFLADNSKKIQYRAILYKYKGITQCNECKGSRIRKDAAYVKINKRSIIDLLLMPIDQLYKFFQNIKLTKYENNVSKKIIEEIKNRINYLINVGLNYLSLNRASSTLSGGEYQRVTLATSLGSTLIGTMYILDEPTIGLHPRDTFKLTNILIKLKEYGNTVIVVEHEEEVMKRADQIIDIGPEAGTNGGEVMFQGTLNELKKFGNSHTANYLNGKETIKIPKFRREWNKSFIIKGARENNLKDIDIEIPLGVLTVITGVSGSGKSSLVKKIIYPAIGENLYMNIPEKGKFDSLEGDFAYIDELEFIDQNPLARSSRSNPVTYIKAYDYIRYIFANLPSSINNKFSPGKFSFNIEGGRCEECSGEGFIKIEMQFMADITLKCEICQGKRFKKEILDIKLKGKNIYDVLEMTVDDAIYFFDRYPEVIERIKPLQDVGLGYIKLGQSSSSLSGGESQRVKLASYIKNNNRDNKHKLFIFDEPTTGLHFGDINKLLKSINRLINLGNTVLIIEHNLDIIKSADWIIDLGPDGGNNGGHITFEGTPENMIKLKDNLTAKYLKEKM
ncbi:MAG: excinuclease ABC subunit UvrA [Bacteroidetes bacterium]|nr:excinuclease ABC subunit UvrA [Bacteroidota bacterium]